MCYFSITGSNIIYEKYLPFLYLISLPIICSVCNLNLHSFQIISFKQHIKFTDNLVLFVFFMY